MLLTVWMPPTYIEIILILHVLVIVYVNSFWRTQIWKVSRPVLTMSKAFIKPHKKVLIIFALDSTSSLYRSFIYKSQQSLRLYVRFLPNLGLRWFVTCTWFSNKEVFVHRFLSYHYDYPPSCLLEICLRKI